MSTSMFKTEKQNNVTIVILTLDSFTHEDNAELMKSFDAFLAEGHKKIVLDLSETQYVSSLILASFVYIQKKVQAAGGTLLFCSIPERVQEILSSTNLDKVFDIAADRQAAVDKLGKK